MVDVGRSRQGRSAVQATFSQPLELTSDLPSKLTSDQPIGLKSKRIIDLILAGTGIILLAPLLLLCALACRFGSNGPALFRHQRVGFRGGLFDCFKFRTMVTDSEDCLREHLESQSSSGMGRNAQTAI
jgi:lipopolysaccharide/colanic/teichoic acid biosynthesis glycosyltransferase